MPAPRGALHSGCKGDFSTSEDDNSNNNNISSSNNSNNTNDISSTLQTITAAAATTTTTTPLDEDLSSATLWNDRTAIRVTVLFLSGEPAFPEGILLRADDRNILATLTDEAWSLLGRGFYRFLFDEIELRPSEPRSFQELGLQDGDHLTLIKLNLPTVVPTKGPESDRGAFAAVLPGGGAVSWGHQEAGGLCPDQARFTDVTVLKVVASGYAFAARTSKGRVEFWGSKKGGGKVEEALEEEVAEKLKSGVVDVFSTRFAFAALKEDGSVVAWGCPKEGGDTSSVEEELSGRRVKNMFSTSRAFAALLEDDSVRVWGHPREGGAFWSQNSENLVGDLGDRLRGGPGVQMLAAGRYAFAALMKDGTVVTWGSVYCPDKTLEILSTGPFVKVVAGQRCFVALSADGSVTPWGFPIWSITGGPSSAFAKSKILRVGGEAELEDEVGGGSSRPTVVDILDSNHPCVTSPDRLEAIPLLFSDGSLALLQNQEESQIDPAFLENDDWSRARTSEFPIGIKTIIGSQFGTAILRDNGELVALGSRGQPPPEIGNATIEAVVPTRQAFAALTTEGQVITWGTGNYGGDSSAVSHLLHNVLYLVSNEYAFCAVRRDGAIVTWGFRNAGGDSASVKDYFPSVEEEEETAEADD